MSLKDDTSRVNKLIAYGKTLLDQDNTKAIGIYEKCVQLSKRLRYDDGTAMSYRRIGYIHGQEGRYQKAIDYYHLAIAYYQKSKSIKDLLIVYNNLGANYRQLGKGDSAIHYYFAAINLIEGYPLDSEDEESRNDILNTHALLHENISTMYGNMENVPKALAYGKKAIQIATQIKDSVRLALAMISTSNAYYVDKNFAQSLAMARQAAAIADAIQRPIPQAKAYHLLSVSYTGMQKPDSAIYAAKKSMGYAKDSDLQLYLTSLMDLADAYHDKKEYAKEEALLKEASQLFESLDNVAFGRNLYEKLSDAKYAMGDYKAAYDFYVKAIVYKDSMMSKENRDVVARLETEYQTAQKEKTLSQNLLQLAQKDLQLQKNRNYMYYTLSALVVTVLVAALLFFRARHKKRLHQREVKAIRQEKEIQLLQAVMQGEEKERSRIAKDLHDGVAGMLAAVKMHFNSIALHVGDVLQAEGYQQGIRLLDEASQEVRKTSHNLMPEVLLQHGLDEAIRRYCNNVTNSSKLLVQYDCIGEMDRFFDSFELSVYRIVQELLNNIVKHSKASEAVVQITYQSQLLSITIEDNGIGLSKDVNAKEGMGLKSLQSRVKAMNGKIEFDSSTGQGLNAYLEFETVGLTKKEEQVIAL